MSNPPGSCPCCGGGFDAHNDPTGDGATPSPGDMTVCWSCLHIGVFADDLTVRAPNADERARIDRDPRLNRLREVMAESPSPTQVGPLYRGRTP